MKEYLRSDLAVEWDGLAAAEGVTVQRLRVGACAIRRVRIHTSHAAERVGKPVGRYVTVECPELCRMSGEQYDEMRRAISVELRGVAERACGKRGRKGLSVLVVGLGNREMTPDAVGPETVRRLSVTRHLAPEERTPPFAGEIGELSALAPGVTGQTGIETTELIRGVVQAVSPDLVVAVDALAARDVAHLVGVVQISDAGIFPGSGIGGRKRALNEETVGVPVIALGVPTVVESSVLICGALRRVGFGEISEEVREVLEAGRAHFVAPKEIDLQVSAAAMLLAEAIEGAFTTDSVFA